MRAARGLALLVLAAVCGACARLPDHAMPSGHVVDVRTREPADAIRYRTLTRQDFLARHPPPRMEAHAHTTGAYTCAEIVPDGPLQARITLDAVAGTFVAEPLEIGYHAIMNRDCSWWNDHHAMPKDYLLQHEQIHFALVELAARALSDRARALSARGPSPQDALAALERAIRAELERTLEEALARNAAFDRDTSGRPRPERQERWYREVMGELDGRRSAPLPGLEPRGRPADTTPEPTAEPPTWPRARSSSASRTGGS